MPVELLAEPIDARRAEPRGRKGAYNGAGTNSAWEPALDGPVSVSEHSARDLPEALAAQWDELAAAAVSPNVFYERWYASAALQRIAAAADVRLVCVWRAPAGSAAPRLCGLFPVVRARSSRMSVAVWRLWGHRYCYLQTPLVRRGHERPVLTAVCDWFAAHPTGPRILDWSLIDGEGPFAQALVDVLRERQLVHLVVDRYNRALLTRQPDWQQAVAARLSSHHRRELRRQARRLEEQGQLTLRSLQSAGDVDRWGADFLQLEAAGWKGSEQTAMATDPATREFLRDLLRTGLDAGRIQMLGLYLNDEPISLKLNLRTGAGSFAFKIAYSERLAKFSPGVQLELENGRVLHEETTLQWMDSCAVANHFMINRLWSGRRSIQRVLISTGGHWANLAVGALPLCQALKRSFLSRPATAVATAE